MVNSTIPTGAGDETLSFESWLTQYWFVLLIVLAVLVVICVLVCACILRKQPRSSSSSFQPQAANHIHVPDENGCSSSQQSASFPTMPSISADSTPIPSPHSSQHSVRAPSSQGGGGSNRSRRLSPRLSSTSSDTLRHGAHSVSSNSSSASLMGVHHNSPSRQSPMERRGSLSRRTRSGPIVRVTSMPDVKDTGGLKAAPSTVSVESSSSGRSGVSYRFQPNTDSDAVVEVGVTVHTPGDPDKAVRIATAAALAESARKLAQEAASFIDDEQPSLLSDHYHSKYRPGSSRSYYSSHPSYPPRHSVATPEHTHPATGRSLMERRMSDYPSLSQNYPPSPYLYNRSTSQFNDSDYHSYHPSPSLDSNPSTTYLDSSDHYNATTTSSSPYQSRFSSASPYQRVDPSIHQRQPRHSFEFSHKPTYHRRSSDNAILYRRPPYHFLSSNRREVSQGNFPPRKLSSFEKRLNTPISSPDIDESAISKEPNRTKVHVNSPLQIVEVEPPTMSVLSVDPAQTVLSHSASNSTGLSSAHTENGSQLEEPSPNPSQDNSQGNVQDIPNSKKSVQLRLSSDSHASSDGSYTETEPRNNNSRPNDQLSSKLSSSEVAPNETKPDDELCTNVKEEEEEVAIPPDTKENVEQIELTSLSSDSKPDSRGQNNENFPNIESEIDLPGNRRFHKYSAPSLNNGNLKNNKTRHEFAISPNSPRPYKFHRENVLSERHYIRQNSFSRYYQSYSPPGDKGLSLSRQSYQMPPHVPSSFRSTSHAPPTSTDVTVDV